MSWLGSLLKKKQSREIDCGLLKGFLLLQTVNPAVCNLGGEESVADRANALSEAEQKRGRKRKHYQKKTKSINPGWRKPKGIKIREGESRGGMPQPPRTNPWRRVEFGKVVIISWCWDFNRRLCRGDGGCCLCVFFFFFFFWIIWLLFKVQNLACSSRYGIKKPPIPLGKSQPPKSLWCGTNRTSSPQQETLD